MAMRFPLALLPLVVGVAVVLAAGCGGGKDEPRSERVNYDNDGGEATFIPLVSCESDNFGELRTCTIYLEIDGLQSCYDGHQVCRGEAGWTECMETGAAEEYASQLMMTGRGGAGGGEGGADAGAGS